MTSADPSTETVANVAERLRFFFSDANLRSDKFLRNEVLNNTGGYVAIETLLKFNTIKKHSDDPAVLVKAVKEDEQVKTRLTLNENETSIARIEPVTKEMLQDNAKVTLRVSNIPVKEEDGKDVYAVTREDVEGLFKEFGHVAIVSMLHFFQRKNGESNRVAIGRAFIEFETAEEMQKAAAELCTTTPEKEGEEAPKPKRILKLGNNEIRVKTYKQWLDKKGKVTKTEEPEKKGEKRKQDEKKQTPKEEPIEFKLDWKKGCVISLKGLPDGCDRETIIETIKDVVGDIESVRADYSRGQKDGAIRFSEPNDKIAELAKKLNEGTALIGGAKLESATVIEGEAEEKYYADFIAFRKRQMQQNREEKLQRKRSRRH